MKPIYACTYSTLPTHHHIALPITRALKFCDRQTVNFCPLSDGCVIWSPAMSAGELNYSDLEDSDDFEKFLKEVELVTSNAQPKETDLRPPVTSSDSPKKLKNAKKKIHALQAELEQKDADLSNAEIQINDLKLANENAKRKMARLSNEILTLKQQLSAKELSCDVSNDRIEHAVSLFEDMVRQQSQEIVELSSQRESLILSVKMLDKICQEYQEEISNRDEEGKRQSEILERATQRCEASEQEMSNLAQSLWNVSKIETSESESSYSYVVRAIEELKQRDVAVQNDTGDDRKMAILSQLEGALEFFLNVTKSRSNHCDRLSQDEKVRHDVIEQCSKMQRFIDESLTAMGKDDLPNKISLFDPSAIKNSDEKLTKFFGFVTDEELERPAMRELFTLFVGVLQVNSVVIDYAEQIRDMFLQLKKNQSVQIERDWTPEVTEQASVAMKEIQRGGGQVCDETDVIPWLMSSWNDQVAQNASAEADLTRRTEELRVFREQLDQLEMDVIKESQAIELDKKSMEHKLNGITEERNALESKLKSMKERVQNYKNKYKLVVAQQNEVTQLVEQCQASVNELLHDKKALDKTVTELRATIKEQTDRITALTSKEKKLKAKKEDLTGRMQDMELESKRTVSELRRRNTTMKSKYDSTIRNLQNDLEEATVNLEREQAEKRELITQKQAMSNELTKLRISQRALQVKITALEERQNLERSLQNAKTSSYVMGLSGPTEKKIEEANLQIDNIKMWITNILEIKFDETVPANATVDDLFVMLQERIGFNDVDRKVVEDARELRKKLEVTRSRGVDDRKTKVEESEEVVSRQKENTEWTSWTMPTGSYMEVSPEELRAIIEENLSSSFDDPTGATESEQVISLDRLKDTQG